MTDDALRLECEKMRDELLCNMSARRGFRRDAVDRATVSEWDTEWLSIILIFAKHQRAAEAREIEQQIRAAAAVKMDAIDMCQRRAAQWEA